MSRVDKPAGIMREVANFLRTLTEDQIDEILSGEAKIGLIRNRRALSKSRASHSSSVDLDDIREQLANVSNREDGHALLERMGLRRAILAELASSMQMPVRKTDTVDKLRESVVEATIGFRLRSHAIRDVPNSTVKDQDPDSQ